MAPEALLSLMARLGSSQPVELRMSLDEIAEGFELTQFGAAPTKLDPEDLMPLTRERNQRLPFAAVAERVAGLGVPALIAERFWEVASKNITTLDDLAPWATLVLEGAEPEVDAEDAEFVAAAMALLPAPPFDGDTWAAWTAAVKAVTGRKGKGLFMPLRKALTGQAHGPEMADLMPLLQKVRGRG